MDGERQTISHLIQMKCLIQFMSVQLNFYTLIFADEDVLRRRRVNCKGAFLWGVCVDSTRLNTHLIN